MAEYSANAIQTVAPGESVIFTASPSPCQMGLVRHRDETGDFLLRGYSPSRRTCNCCPCRSNAAVEYFVDFGANISIPEGGTPGTISLAFAINGSTLPATTMETTPAAVNEPSNVSEATGVPIWRGCCQTLTVRNTSDQPIQVANANIVFTRPDLYAMVV